MIMSSIRIMKTFLAVVRHGSFARAGKHIGLTPAAVGLQMRALEEELRCRLFDRGPSNVVLNPAARAMVPQFEEIIRRYESLSGAADSHGLSGAVVMGALVSALMGRFSDALWMIKQQHPNLDVRLFAGLSNDFMFKVEQGELDAAVVTQPPRALARNIIWTKLYSEPLILIVPRRPHFDLPKQPRDMLRHAPLLRFDSNTWTGVLVEEFIRRCDVQVRVDMELNSVEAIIELVRQGMGISIVPRLANVDWHRDHALHIVDMPKIGVHRNVGLIERREHARMRFTDVIKAYFDADAQIKFNKIEIKNT
jgi:DNA-binding transcriptional LysR family regulator